MMTEAQTEALVFDLPQGLPAASLEALDRLASASVAAPAGSARTPAVVPFLWPILALSAAPAQSLRERLRSDGESVIVHETLRLRAGIASLAQGSPLQISIDQASLSANRLSVSFRDRQGRSLADLTSGLRRLTGQALAELKSVTLERVARGQPLRRLTTPPLTQARVDAFVTLIQDPNPIHTDRAQARAAGVSDTVVPGALIAAMLEPALPALLPGKRERLCGLSVRFMGVLETGSAVTFATSEAAGPVGVPARVFMARPDGMLVAIADLDLNHAPVR